MPVTTSKGISITKLGISNCVGIGMIDWQRVSELRRDLGDDGFDEVIEIFLDEVEERLGELETKPVDQLSEHFHFLKGCAANLGFATFQEICAEGEASGNTGSIEAAISAYEVSKTEFLAGPDGA